MIMRRYSYKTGLVIGLFLFSIGTFLFYPAALNGSFGFFLVALFVIASGLAFLETGANPYIAVMGDPHSAARRLNFSQAFNPLGAITGVSIGTVFILSGIELKGNEIEAMKAAGTYQHYLQTETMRVVTPYIVLSVVTFIWALLMLRTKFPALKQEERTTVSLKESLGRLFHRPHFLKGVLAQFFYVGAQVGTWSFFIQYVQDYTDQPEKVAGYFLVGSLVAFGVGRFSAAWFMRFIQPEKLMGVYAIVNIILVSIGIIHPGWVGMWCVFFTSFFMSLMFPTIFALSIRGLGEDTKLGASMIVMAIIGGAVFTPVMGYIAISNMALAMTVPLTCYIYITYYAYFGSKGK
jgi:FHS family L-fucose permease-like MFS transporter